MLLLVCRSISLMISASDTFLIDRVASMDLARDPSAFVNLATLLTTHFWKIKLLPLHCGGGQQGPLVSYLF